MEHNNVNGETSNSYYNVNIQEHEKALVDLVDSAKRDIKNFHHSISYYTSQLKDAEKRLEDYEAKLARLGAKTSVALSLTSASLSDVGSKVTKTSNSNPGIPIHRNEGSSRNQHQSNSQRLTPKTTTPVPLSCSHSRDIKPQMPHSYRVLTHKENANIRLKGTKRKFELQQHKELIPLIGKTSSPCSVNYQTSNHISDQHKRKVRSLALCPVNDKLFVTSALDGVVNLWQVNSNRSGISLNSSKECLSPYQKRWPEDIAWHPDGNKLFLAHSADGGPQISVMDLSKVQGEGLEDINFLEEKPHVKDVINSIVFLPWENPSFVTAGTDHAVILWNENSKNKWKPKTLHVDLHSSAVMGVAGMQQKHIVLSAGKDKKILGYDAYAGRKDFIHQIDSKCLSVLPNPCDFNLFMVQAGTPEKQLRLFDIRTKRIELHAFGWKQESSESQSALVNQAWSPNGMYITSGSADPNIHIFDIRYNGQSPSQSIKAHKKRVFKAMWLQSVPLLISISSDHNIGLNKIV